MNTDKQIIAHLVSTVQRLRVANEVCHTTVRSIAAANENLHDAIAHLQDENAAKASQITDLNRQFTYSVAYARELEPLARDVETLRMKNFDLEKENEMLKAGITEMKQPITTELKEETNEALSVETTKRAANAAEMWKRLTGEQSVLHTPGDIKAKEEAIRTLLMEMRNKLDAFSV